VDQVGRVLGTGAFPADAAGYQAAVAWMNAHGELAVAGVEGTGSYGTGRARYLAACGVKAAGVIRPNRQARQRGQSDTADAVAALAGCSGTAGGSPRPFSAGPGRIRGSHRWLARSTRPDSTRPATRSGPTARSSPSPSPIVQSVALAADPCPALWWFRRQAAMVGKVRALDVTGRRAGAVARGRVVPCALKGADWWHRVR
jgi:hypothetical protein